LQLFGCDEIVPTATVHYAAILHGHNTPLMALGLVFVLTHLSPNIISTAL